MTSALKKKRGREKILHLSMQDRIFIATGNNQLFFSLPYEVKEFFCSLQIWFLVSYLLLSIQAMTSFFICYLRGNNNFGTSLATEVRGCKRLTGNPISFTLVRLVKSSGSIKTNERHFWWFVMKEIDPNINILNSYKFFRRAMNVFCNHNWNTRMCFMGIACLWLALWQENWRSDAYRQTVLRQGNS